MEQHPSPQDQSLGVALRLSELRRFSGAPREFWTVYLDGLGRLCAAGKGWVLTRYPQQGPDWQILSAWEGGLTLAVALPDPAFLDLATTRGMALDPAGGGGAGRFAMALDIGPNQPQVLVVLILTQAVPPAELALRAVLAADIPALYQQGREYQQARGDVVRVAEILDLIGRLYAERTFARAALTLCEEMAVRFRCAQVGLGWLDGDRYVRLAALSHMTRFDAKMNQVKDLEAAMEEAADQDCEILWPSPEGRREIILAHDRCARELAMPHMATLPLRVDGEIVGVLWCGRRTPPFDELDLWSIRLAADHAVRWLNIRHKGEMPWRDRLTRGAETLIERLREPRRLGLKLGILGGVLALLALVAVPWTYRVDATFLLKTHDVRVLPAPFDGFLTSVHVRRGDAVAAGQDLAEMDTRQLRLDQAAALAEQTRYLQEADKARSRGELADMRIAEAQRQQVEARLAQLADKVSGAALKAPLDGMVVEGDLKEILGAPVRQGDTLFKVAATSNYYAELRVGERDIHELAPGQTGEMAFVGQPDRAYGFTVAEITPVAEVAAGANGFVVRVALTDAADDWWRPGMSGVAKVAVGSRSLLWIATHRTVEFLRLFLWW